MRHCSPPPLMKDLNMNCACGHHAPDMHHDCEDTGQKITLARPLIALNGRLICEDAPQMMAALSLLPDHMALSRQEPGCLRFDVWQDEDPMVWNLTELFADQEALEHHQARMAESEWGQGSTDLRRDFVKEELFPAIRPEATGDHDKIDLLLESAFEGRDESRLVRALRRDGDLALSLVATAAGQVVGHVALSRIEASQPVLALAPLAVAPPLQSRGLGSALVAAALAHAGATSVVVLGSPDYYRRFGFETRELVSPYSGPYLMARGDIPAGTVIRHAPAFDGL